MREPTRAAAIDIGTNTVLLTIAERERRGPIRALVERARICRLGEGVDRTRRLDDRARARTLAVLSDYAVEIRDADVARVGVVGTSALRDAEGAQAFIDEVEQLLGVRPRVIDGAEEAELTFVGGLSGLDLDGKVIVFDVGGGSTEIAVGGEGRIDYALSLDIGSVRLFERFVRGDPPTDAELGLVRDTIRAELRRLPEAPKAKVVGVAGTVTTLAALAHQASELHGVIVSHAVIASWASKLAQLSLAERRALAAIETGRADVIPIGAAIVDEILAWARADSLVVSDRGVRWGLLERLLALDLGRE